MAIDETGRDPAPSEVDAFDRPGCFGQIAHRPDPDDALTFGQDCALFDGAEPGHALGEGSDTSVGPKPRRGPILPLIRHAA
jgi:hypothetical protein